MPYLILIIGLLIGFYALYQFFLTANPQQIKALGKTSVFVVLCLALFVLAASRRLPAALVLLIVAFPFIWKFIKAKLASESSGQSPPSSASMTRAEALKVLDLEDGADEAAIQEAYKRLMLKVHPDNQGSDWMAAKLNQARDLLLKP